MGEGKLPGDLVEGLEPVAFAVDFTRAMRRQKTARCVPSLRTSVAIPRLLTARLLRVGALSPGDYVAAAVLCTPPEDQDLAEAVARALVFPETDAEAPRVTLTESPDVASEAAGTDPLGDLLGDLAALDIDLDAIDDLGALLDDVGDDDGSEDNLGAFDLFEGLYASADPAERGLGELIHAFGGPAELEASAIRSLFLARVWVARQLLARVGELTPSLVFHAVAAGYAPDLRRACTEPWELAGVLAGEGGPELEPLLDDLLVRGTCRELGRTLAFLGPHPALTARRDTFSNAALGRALDLSDFAELVVGLGAWMDPPDTLCDASLAVSARRTLEAAAWLASVFGIDLRPDLFSRWLATQARPDLGLLTVVAVPCPAWDQAVAEALAREIARLDAVPNAIAAADPMPGLLEHGVRLCAALRQTELDAGIDAATRLATALLVHVPAFRYFLPLLDALVAHRVVPHDVDAVLVRSRALGVPDGEVLDRIGQAVEQLRQLVLTTSHDADRYQRLIARIAGLPPELMAQLCQRAAADGNLEAMAALLAVDMGAAVAWLPEGLAAEAVSYKGIGGGHNLLRQWFTHRGRIGSPTLKAHIKVQARAALLDAALDWAGKGGGSGERGLVPQQATRPYRAGDGVDALDLESTLESIIASGKPLDQVTEEDLFATETARGRAALCVLVDISGSMGGGELAACAIAVVMLLGRLLPEEVALAVFESDTHVLKTFDDPTRLEEVADRVLDLAATGGTRADAALKWAAGQFDAVTEADVRVLFLLSDFAFFEGEQALTARGQALAERGARLLAASHGHVDRKTRTLLLDTVGGEALALDDLDELPSLLLEALQQVGE